MGPTYENQGHNPDTRVRHVSGWARVSKCPQTRHSSGVSMLHSILPIANAEKLHCSYLVRNVSFFPSLHETRAECRTSGAQFKMLLQISALNLIQAFGCNLINEQIDAWFSPSDFDRNVSQVFPKRSVRFLDSQVLFWKVTIIIIQNLSFRDFFLIQLFVLS